MAELQSILATIVVYLAAIEYAIKFVKFLKRLFRQLAPTKRRSLKKKRKRRKRRKFLLRLAGRKYPPLSLILPQQSLNVK